MTERSLAALHLAREAERYAPEEVRRVRQGWLQFNLRTEPEGAQVEIKNYIDVDGPWVPIGTSPVRNFLVPFGYYRVRITKPGYVPVELSSASARTGTDQADATGRHARGHGVRAGRPLRHRRRPSRHPAGLLDRPEGGDQQAFKRFVDAGGYRDPEVLEGAVPG